MFFKYCQSFIDLTTCKGECILYEMTHPCRLNNVCPSHAVLFKGQVRTCGIVSGELNIRSCLIMQYTVYIALIVSKRFRHNHQELYTLVRVTQYVGTSSPLGRQSWLVLILCELCVSKFRSTYLALYACLYISLYTYTCCSQKHDH